MTRIFFFAVLFSLTPLLHAGAIFVPGQMKGDKFEANSSEDAAELNYQLEFAELTGEIAGRKADMQLTETIVGPDKEISTVLLLPLVEGVVDKSINLRLNREGKEATVVSRIYNAEDSQKLLESIAKATGDVRTIALSGARLAVANVSLQGRMSVAVDFQATAQTGDEIHSIALPLCTAEFSSEPVKRIDARLTLTSDLPQRVIYSPSHEATISRESLNKAIIRVKAENWEGNEDLKLLWVADESDLGLRVLTYRESKEEDGYFMIIGNPTGGDREKPIAKDVVFVLDTSGSMRGEKIEQCRAAIEYCLTQLQPEDRFNIVTFGTEVNSLARQPVSIEKANLTKAQNFVEDIVAHGKTNIEGALKASFEFEHAEGRPRMIIFLTDGVPTAGELRPEKIVEQIPQWNTRGARVFVMGAGNDVNAHLLDKISSATQGSSEYINPTEEIDEKVAALYNRLAHPVLTNVAVNFGDLNTSSQYPQKLGPLFRNTELMVLGRFQEGGKHKIAIQGELNGEKKEFSRVVEFPTEKTTTDREYVAPLWATRNIGHLLQQIRLHGEDKELLEEVVRLSKKFGIVTEYTAFLGHGGAALDAQALQNEVNGRLFRANSVQTGKWAVNQARNDIGLQQRGVVNRSANAYFDRRGEKVVANNIRQIGAGCFYLNDGQWIDSHDVGDRKERKVELFSDEFFALLKQHKDFRRAQQLGWAMAINIGDERIVVVKDGKHQSEELLKKSPQEAQQLQNQFRGRINNNNAFQNDLNDIQIQQRGLNLQNFRNNNR